MASFSSKNKVSFTEENRLNAPAVDWDITQHLANLANLRTYAHQGNFKYSFINGVKALQILCMQYWMFDQEYKLCYRALLNWRKKQLEVLPPGSNIFECEIPLLTLELPGTFETPRDLEPINELSVETPQGQLMIQRKQGEIGFEIEEVRQVTRDEFELISSDLNWTLLMKAISKATKTFEAQDELY